MRSYQLGIYKQKNGPFLPGIIVGAGYSGSSAPPSQVLVNTPGYHYVYYTQKAALQLKEAKKTLCNSNHSKN